MTAYWSAYAKSSPLAQRGAVLEELLRVIQKRVAIGVVYAGNPDSSGTVVERTANARPWKSYRQVAEQIVEALKSASSRHYLAITPLPFFYPSARAFPQIVMQLSSQLYIWQYTRQPSSTEIMPNIKSSILRS